MMEIIGKTAAAREYSGFAEDTRAMTCLQSLELFEPRSPAMLATHCKNQDGAWKNTAELFAALSSVFDYISANEGDEIALKLLNGRPQRTDIGEQLV